MHILLTDVLTCPRCGPEHGLILLAERMEGSRVMDGTLGCANCREQYRVSGGAVRFGSGGDAVRVRGDEGGGGRSGRQAGRPEDVHALPLAGPAGQHDGEAALRLAALLGVMHGPGFVLLAGPAAVHAAALAQLIDGVEVIVTATASQPAAEGVNVLDLAAAERLPLATGRMQAVALTGAAADALLAEAARVLSPVGRLVLQPAPAQAPGRLAPLGLRVLAHEGDTMIAVRA